VQNSFFFKRLLFLSDGQTKRSPNCWRRKRDNQRRILMKTLDRYQLEGMGFNAPEGPCLANGRLLRFFILRSKPWLGVEEYLPAQADQNDEAESEVYAVNYGKHY